MKLIKIINGTYGYRPAGSKYIEPKQASDPPFEVDDSKAERLVSLGVAAYINRPDATVDTINKKLYKGVATAFKEDNKQDEGINHPEKENSSDGTENPQDVPEYNVDMKAAELRELMDDCGLTYKVGMSKADMVDVLDDYFSEETKDAETPPDLDAEDPVI